MDEQHAKIALGAGAPTAEEAAAAIAAIEAMLRETSEAPPAVMHVPDSWRETALCEGVEREALADLRDPWIKA